LEGRPGWIRHHFRRSTRWRDCQSHDQVIDADPIPATLSASTET
jgi:hypothetical protein